MEEAIDSVNRAIGTIHISGYAIDKRIPNLFFLVCSKERELTKRRNRTFLLHYVRSFQSNITGFHWKRYPLNLMVNLKRKRESHTKPSEQYSSYYWNRPIYTYQDSRRYCQLQSNTLIKERKQNTSKKRTILR